MAHIKLPDFDNKHIESSTLSLNQIASTLRELAFPTRFAVEVTSECNLACSMCHHPQMKRPKGKMPFELWKRCADQIVASSPDTQCWFSFIGDPLMEPELLFKMLSYGKTVGLQSQNVNTNGMSFTPDIAEQFLDSGADLIVFGIDGYSKEVFEKIRVNADRDVVYANVEHLVALRNSRSSSLEIQVQFIEMYENQHELVSFKNYWSNRGVTLKIRKKLSWGGRFETPLNVPNEKRIACPWAITMMHIFWDGRVPRCPGDTEGTESAGNAWDESLAAIWERLGIYRNMHLHGRFDELPERCQTCKDWMTGAAERIQT